MSTPSDKARVLGVFQKHANHHGGLRKPGVVNVVGRLGLAVFGYPTSIIRAASKNGEVARSAWAEINGKHRYFCFDHETWSIAMKDKKGGKVLARFDDNTSDADIIRLLAL